jgi:hypothetical protein
MTMPKWNIHNKWAKKMRISGEVSNFVDKLIDFPGECQEFSEYQRKVYRIEHDSGRRRNTVIYIQLNFLRQRGAEFVKAWFLQHALDYIKGASILSIKEVLKRLEERTEVCPELEIVQDFVKKNLEEIRQDCGGE